MKRILWLNILLMVFWGSQALAQMHEGMMGDYPEKGASGDYSQEYYPMGPGMMMGGCGMMGNRMGYGMGPGMMMGGYDMGRGMMHGMMGYGRGHHWAGVQNPEKYEKILNDTVELRKKIHDKNFEYFEAQRKPDTARKVVLGIEKELFELNQQLREKMFNEMDKE